MLAKENTTRLIFHFEMESMVICFKLCFYYWVVLTCIYFKDESYEQIFVPIMSKVMETYQPSAVVLQCGADSLSGDRLGCFNLTLKGILNFFIFILCIVLI